MTATQPGLAVAVAQIETVLGDVTANLDKHLDVIAEARAASVDVLVFPELSLTGYSLDVRARDIALHADDRLFHKIAQAGGPMAVTVGYVESGPVRPYNAAMTVRDGRALANHRKLNLPGYGRLEEPKWFGGGEALDCFEIAPGWRAATLICADLWNPALVHVAACAGASLLLVPISSAHEAVGEGFSNPHGWQVALDFYSMMYGLPILMANRVGREGALTFWGGSRILDGFGRVVASAAGAECLVVGRLRSADVEKARGLLPTVRDSDPALVRALFDRLAAGRSAA
jgi:predicted amidohydrolase